MGGEEPGGVALAPSCAHGAILIFHSRVCVGGPGAGLVTHHTPLPCRLSTPGSAEAATLGGANACVTEPAPPPFMCTGPTVAPHLTPDLVKLVARCACLPTSSMPAGCYGCSQAPGLPLLHALLAGASALITLSWLVALLPCTRHVFRSAPMLPLAPRPPCQAACTWICPWPRPSASKLCLCWKFSFPKPTQSTSAQQCRCCNSPSRVKPRERAAAATP